MVSVADIESIESLKEAPEGILVYGRQMRASPFILRRIHPHYNQLYKRLWWAQQGHWFGVKVAIANGLVGIEDVQWARMFKSYD